MKSIHKLLILFAVVIVAWGCRQKEFRTVYPAGDPQLEAQLLTADVLYGTDSIAFRVKITETQTPLSTLTIKIVAATNVLVNEVVRTKDYAFENTYRYAVPFIANMPDNEVIRVFLTATNVEGTDKIVALDGCIGHRPEIPTLYIMPPTINYTLIGKGRQMTDDNGTFVAYDLEYPKSVEFLLATVGTKFGRVDWTKPVFGMYNGNLALITKEQFDAGEANAITLSDENLETLDTITFNPLTFALTYGGKVAQPVTALDVQNDLEKSPAYIASSGVAKRYRGAKVFFDKDSEVEITGCTDLSKACNMDWMEYLGGNKVKFLGEKAMYYVSYDIVHDYIVVEPLYEMVYPDVMYLCGVGMGHPNYSDTITSGWGFDSPNQNFVGRQVSDGVYQFTVYMFNEQSTDYKDYGSLNFKFFHQHGWNGEEDGSTYTQVGLNIQGIDSTTGVTKDGETGDGSTGNETGNWLATNEPFSGVYRITLDTKQKTTTYEKLRE